MTALGRQLPFVTSISRPKPTLRQIYLNGSCADENGHSSFHKKLSRHSELSDLNNLTYRIKLVTKKADILPIETQAALLVLRRSQEMS